MALILRETKGSPLSFGEMDGNLTYLGEKGFPFTGDATIDGTLNIDFTETLSFFSEENESVYSGMVFFPMAGWIPLNTIGDVMSFVFEDEDALIRNGMFDLVIDPGSGPLPVVSSGKIMEVKSGVYSGSVFTNSVAKNPNGYGSTEMALRVKEGSDNRQYLIECIADLVNGNDDGLVVRKTNEAGEVVEIQMNNTNTGFITSNNLADDTASIHRFDNNNAETILDLLNDNLQSDVVLSHGYADDAAAALGGVPVGGFYHNAGALRIRLT
jgi:hypothetical protein